jgi:DNA-binding MarR family transcriptional regulator
MAELDDIIHQPLRLKIMAALNALPATGGLEFSRLKKLTSATDGNLGAHIETLTKAGYVSVEKAFVGKKPQTTVTATATGRSAFARQSRRCRRSLRGSKCSFLRCRLLCPRPLRERAARRGDTGSLG